MKILIIEDDAATAAYVANGLKQGGHSVDHAPDVRDGLVLAVGHTYDVMIVDRMLAGLDGLGIVKTIRSTGVKTPVLFLTALGGIDERVAGLEAGGDDYLVKPFAFSALLPRIVWECPFDPKTNIVETHISRLRAKVDRGQGAELIQTVRGSGYMLRAPS